MSHLTKPPVGFISWLNLHNEGRNPWQVEETLYPFIELGDNYLATRLTNATATGNVTNAGDVAELTVPAGQLWRVRSVWASHPFVPGTDSADPGINVGVRLLPAAALNTLAVNYSPGAGPRIMAVAAILQRPLILGAGGISPSIYGGILNNMGAARVMTVGCVYERLDTTD